VDKPFKFPAKPEDCVPIKIDVFRHVGTARTVSQAGSQECKLVLDPIASSEGAPSFSAGDMQIAFQVRPASKDATQSIGYGGVDPVKKSNAIANTDKYLEQHKIPQFLQAVLQGLIKEQPLDEEEGKIIDTSFCEEGCQKVWLRAFQPHSKMHPQTHTQGLQKMRKLHCQEAW